jgi:hypothetical protein
LFRKYYCYLTVSPENKIFGVPLLKKSFRSERQKYIEEKPCMQMNPSEIPEGGVVKVEIKI